LNALAIVFFNKKGLYSNYNVGRCHTAVLHFVNVFYAGKSKE
jgi:hypothetical protein